VGEALLSGLLFCFSGIISLGFFEGAFSCSVGFSRNGGFSSTIIVFTGSCMSQTSSG
jgi:hypothetical protein